MTHTITLPPWQIEHFRTHDECLLLLPVTKAQPKPGERRTMIHPYQPGDVLEICIPSPDPASQRVTGEFGTPVCRKLVVSETAKRAGDVTVAESVNAGYRRGFGQQESRWNADHPAHPWHADLHLWAVELRNAT
jgi:hypothetical protein